MQVMFGYSTLDPVFHVQPGEEVDIGEVTFTRKAVTIQVVNAKGEPQSKLVLRFRIPGRSRMTNALPLDAEGKCSYQFVSGTKGEFLVFDNKESTESPLASLIFTVTDDSPVSYTLKVF